MTETPAQRHARLIETIKRATPTEIHSAVEMPSELPEHFLAVVNDLDAKGPAAFGAASWLARFDAILVFNEPLGISPYDLAEQLAVFNRVVIVSTRHTFRFWMSLIADIGLSGKLFAKCPAEMMEKAETLN